jgi:WD40 repeat protein
MVGHQVLRFHESRACRRVRFADEQVHNRHFDFSPDGRLLVAGRNEGGSYSFHESIGGRAIGHLPPLRPPESANKGFPVAFHPDGQSVITATPYGLDRWRLRIASNSVEVLGQDQFHPGRFHCTMALAGNSLVVADSENHRALWFDLRQTNPSAVALSHTRCQDVSVTPDGRYAATGSWGGNSIRVWSSSGKLVARLGGDGNAQPFLVRTTNGC